MTERLFDGHNSNVLADIHEGMDVFDLDGGRVGKVDRVQFGSDEVGGAVTETPSATPERGSSLVDDLAEAIASPKRVHPSMDQRLQRHGFIRIGGGLFGRDLFATPDQIAGVQGDRVVLRVSHRELTAG